jgi:hypothetical protein
VTVNKDLDAAYRHIKTAIQLMHEGSEMSDIEHESQEALSYIIFVGDALGCDHGPWVSNDLAD